MKKMIAQVLSVAFLLIGVLGFINDPVLGIFGVDAPHNWVHIMTGLLGFALTIWQDEKGATLFGQIMTVVYGLVTVLGFITLGAGLMTPEESLLGLMHINGADNYLHLVFTAVFAYLGFAKAPQHAVA